MPFKNQIEKIYEDIEGNVDDDINYEDSLQDQEAELSGSRIEYRRKLLELPVEALPCPSKLSFGASYSPPTQDEVKYYKSSSYQVITVSLSWCLILLLTLHNILR